MIAHDVEVGMLSGNVHPGIRNIQQHFDPSASRMIHLESRVRENRTPGSESREWKRT